MLSLFALALTLQAPNPSVAAAPDDVKSPDRIIAAMYDVISGPAGQKRNWTRFRSLFSPKGTLSALVKNREGQLVLVTMTPDDYVNRSGPVLETRGFFERERKRKTAANGNILQVFSEYESRNLPTDPKPFEIGTNAIQLYTDGTRWYVHSILWQAKA